MKNNGAQEIKKGYRSASCAVCGSDDYKPLFEISQRQIVECKDCGHEYINPVPVTPDRKYFFLPNDDVLGTEIEISYLKRIFKKYGLVNCKLLDLGCGVGRLEQGLIELGWNQRNLYLMDISESNLETARMLYKSANIVLGDAEEGISFSDYFDCILMVEFLEHSVDTRRVMENALSALKNNGLVIIRGLPNNRSLEAFIGQDKWKMRNFEDHYQFFNPETFSLFVESFKGLEILEFGCFLQEGYHFYNIPRIAKDIGVIGLFNYQNHGGFVEIEKLTELVLSKLRNTEFNDYPYGERIELQRLARLSSMEEIEKFFDSAHLDYSLSPDFSAVVRKFKEID